MSKINSFTLAGFIAGVLALFGARQGIALAWLCFVHPLPVVHLPDAIIGALALPMGVALLFGARHALIIARFYLGLNLVGEALLVITCFVLHWHALLPGWTGSVTWLFMLVCFCLSFEIDADKNLTKRWSEP
jgi:hypothetical protein